MDQLVRPGADISSGGASVIKQAPITSLTPEQEREFFFSGCLLLVNFFSASDLAALQKDTEEIEKWPEPGKNDKYTLHTEMALGNRVLCRVENHTSQSSVWDDVARGRLQKVVGQLFECGEAHLFKEKINWKRPGGGGYAPHYDGPSPAALGLAANFITAQIALDDQTVQNGGLWIVKPRNRWPDTSMGYGVASVKSDADPDGEGRPGAISAEVADSLEWQPQPAPAGSVLIFDHWAPHRSQTNVSPKTRRAAFLLYNPMSEGDHHEGYVLAMRRLRAEHAAKGAATKAQQCADDAADAARAENLQQNFQPSKSKLKLGMESRLPKAFTDKKPSLSRDDLIVQCEEKNNSWDDQKRQSKWVPVCVEGVENEINGFSDLKCLKLDESDY